MAQEFDLIDFITSQTTPVKFDGGGPVQGFNGRGNSLVTSDPPTGRTPRASSGFDMVDGIAVPEDRL